MIPSFGQYPFQAQRLAHIPAVEIDVIHNRVLDHIALLFEADREMPLLRMRLDEACVVVAMG